MSGFQKFKENTHGDVFIFALIYLCGCAGNKNIRLGQEYALSGDWDSSIQAFQDALQDDPDNQEAKLLLARSKKNASMDHLTKGETLLAAKRYDEALTELQTSLAFDSTNLKAESLLEKAKSMKESDYYVKKGLAFEKSQSYSQAKEAFQKALDLNSETKARRRPWSATEKPMQPQYRKNTP